MYLDGNQLYFLGAVLYLPRKTTLEQVGETVVSRCFVGCLGQARKRCSSNRCCCGLRNYPSDVRPTDPLAAAGVESPSQTLSPGVVFITSNARLKYKKKQPSDRGGSSLVRHVKCSTFSHRIIFAVEKNTGWLFCPPVGYFLIYPTTWISRQKTRLVTVHA